MLETVNFAGFLKLGKENSAVALSFTLKSLNIYAISISPCSDQSDKMYSSFIAFVVLQAANKLEFI